MRSSTSVKGVLSIMPKRCRPSFELLDSRRLMHGAVDLAINFAPKHVPGVDGYLADVGSVYGDRGDGLLYGWTLNNASNARDRNKTSDQRLDTLAMMQVGGRKTWEIALPNGDYTVTITAGDAKYYDGVNVIRAEDTTVVKNTPSKDVPFSTRSKVITVGDGKLTIRPGTGAVNAKIDSIRIVAVDDGDDHGTDQTQTITAAAVDATATEGNDDPGLIRLTRDASDTTASLTLSLNWSGSAANTKDLSSPRPGSVTFAAGQTAIDLPVVARTDDIDEPDETAKLTILTGSGYVVGSPATASVIVKNTLAVTPDPDPTPEPTTLSNFTWATTAAPPSSFTETQSDVVDGKMYLIGGFTAAFVPQSKVYAFDGTAFTTRADAPAAFTHAGHAVVDSTIWFAGGYVGTGNGGQTFGTTAVRVYDTTTDTWTLGPSLPAARAAGDLVKVGRSLYYFGGEDANRVHDVTTMWALNLDDPSAGWVTKTSVPLSRNHASSLAIGTKIYVLGGQTGFDDNLTTHDDIQTYDTATDTWTVATQKLPGGRSHTVNSTVFYDGKIVLIGGESSHNVPTSDVWAIDPTTLATSVFTAFPDRRLSAVVGVLDDKLFVFGGYNTAIDTHAYVGTPIET